MVENTIEIITLFTYIIEQYSSAIASFIMAIIVSYFNWRMLKLNIRDRERPMIVELFRFCIVPLKEWLEFQKSLTEPEELNLEELLRSALTREGKYEVLTIPRYPQPPHPKLLCVEFHSLLERLKAKNDWDKKCCRYNEFRRELSGDIVSMKQRISKLIDEDPDIRKRYEETEAKKAYSFDRFKEELTEKFYECYRSNGLHDAWSYAGKEIFDRVKVDVDFLLKKVDKQRESMATAINNLIILLEDFCKRLRKEYHLTPSEQEPLIKLARPRSF